MVVTLRFERPGLRAAARADTGERGLEGVRCRPLGDFEGGRGLVVLLVFEVEVSVLAVRLLGLDVPGAGLLPALDMPDDNFLPNGSLKTSETCWKQTPAKRRPQYTQ